LSEVRRPLGVTILSMLHVLLGILFLLGSLALVVVGFVLPEIFPHVRFFAVRSVAVGVLLLVLAVVDFGLASWLWVGKHWAWIAAMVFAALGIVFSIFTLFVRPGIAELVTLILDLIIIYYLIQPQVQTYFGRREGPSAGASGLANIPKTPLQTTGPTPLVMTASCPSCGAPTEARATYCAHCGAKLS
jgi:uncharacterized membrane protein (DUF2068 family)